jgi:hypothetical protein
MRTPRRALLSLLAAALLTSPPAAALDKRACVEAADTGQDLKLQGELVRARASFVACADASCPDAVRSACAAWLNQVEGALPTVVLGAESTCGGDLSAVEVTMDGRPWRERLDGHAAPMDPGEHAIDLRAAGHRPHSQRFILREGEKARAVHAQLESLDPSCGQAAALPRVPTPQPEAAAPSGHSALAFASAGVSIAALGVFAVTAAVGHSEYLDLERECDHSCTSSEKSPVTTKFVIADVGLAIGVIGAVVATWLFLAPHRKPSPPSVLALHF